MNRNINVQSILIYRGECENPRFSVVIPTYRRSAYLKKAIESALNQKDFDLPYEIIVINNDHTRCGENLKVRQMIESMNCKFLFYYENAENLGQYGNWNRGIELARSNWVCLCHDDDRMDQDSLAAYYAILHSRKNPDNIGYIRPNFKMSRQDQVDAVQKQMEHDPFSRLGSKLERVFPVDFVISGSHAATAPPTCGTLINKRAITECGGFDEGYFPAGDEELIYRIARKYKIYRTIRHMGIYGTGINETLSAGMKKKFVDSDYRQLHEMRIRYPACSLFVRLFYDAIFYTHHKILTAYGQKSEELDYAQVDFNKLSARLKLKIILYRFICGVYFKSKKLFFILFGREANA